MNILYTLYIDSVCVCIGNHKQVAHELIVLSCTISCAIVCSNDRQIKVPRCNAISTWLFSAASEKRNRLRLKTRLGILKESQHAHAIERVVPGSMCDNGGWQQKFTLVKSSFGTHVIFLLSIG